MARLVSFLSLNNGGFFLLYTWSVFCRNILSGSAWTRRRRRKGERRGEGQKFNKFEKGKKNKKKVRKKGHRRPSSGFFFSGKDEVALFSEAPPPSLSPSPLSLSLSLRTKQPSKRTGQFFFFGWVGCGSRVWGASLLFSALSLPPSLPPSLSALCWREVPPPAARRPPPPPLQPPPQSRSQGRQEKTEEEEEDTDNFVHELQRRKEAPIRSW